MVKVLSVLIALVTGSTCFGQTVVVFDQSKVQQSCPCPNGCGCTSGKPGVKHYYACPTTLTGGGTCAASGYTGRTMVVLTPPSMPVAPQAVATVQQQLGVRVPQGHTHTCSNGHTWDHSITAGHACPVCGQEQWVQDSVPRPVTVVQARQPVGTQTYSIPVTQYQFQSSGGCPNGQCPTAPQSRGFFRR